MKRLSLSLGCPFFLSFPSRAKHTWRNLLLLLPTEVSTVAVAGVQQGTLPATPSFPSGVYCTKRENRKMVIILDK